MDISKHIAEWQKKLILARDPNEQAHAIYELERLMDIEMLLQKQQKGIADIGSAIPLPSASHRNSLSAPTYVLIIHGHDELMKREVQLFINRCGLYDLVWHEVADGNHTIIEKLTDSTYHFAYVIALLSPDDLQPDGTYRARQNVMFEIGFYIGKLGRSKVRMLRKGNTHIPTDLHGILFTDYDLNGNWRISLAKEMKAAGVAIDLHDLVDRF